MSPQSILIGQIFVVIVTILLTTWYATQWVAGALAFDPYLGQPWFVIGDYQVYAPYKFFIWWYSFEPYAPHVFERGGKIAATGGFIGTLFAIIGSVFRGRYTGKLNTFGSSRWANNKLMKRAGLFQPSGVFLGRTERDYIRHDGAEHIMAVAPTRSGKGVGLVVPTLLSWTDSAIIHDIKGENWELTSGWRSKFSHCLLFDPTNPRSAKYNPLLEVRMGETEVRDVQNIADILVDPEGMLERRNHWEKTAHSLLVGAILHVLYAEEEKTLARVASFLSDPERSFKETLDIMMQTQHLGDGLNMEVHPVVAQAARELLNKSDNERSGVLSTAMSFLSLYRDPVVAEVTSQCDWRINDLVSANKPVSLYLVVPPSDISRTKPLVRLILNQIGRRLTEKLEADGLSRRKVLFMLDEFPALGRLDFFESALAYMAGYGLRAFLIAQSLNQIEKAYGQNNAILDNCHVRVVFATNDERTAKRISDAIGSTTEMRAMRNYAGHRLAPWLAHVMVSRQETARQLITPGEVMQLPSDAELILLAGFSPIRARKIRYFTDQNFTDRVLSAFDISPISNRYPDAPSPSQTSDWYLETGEPRTRSVEVKKINEKVEHAFDQDTDDLNDKGGKDKDIPLPETTKKSPEKHIETDKTELELDEQESTISLKDPDFRPATSQQGQSLVQTLDKAADHELGMGA